MKKFLSLFAAIFFAASMMADYELVYTLDGSVTDGGNSNYAQDGGGLTQNGIEWSVTGNTTMNPWRIGGKSLEGVDRLAYSKTAISDDIAKIEIEHGTKTLSAVNSMKVEVASDAAFENIVSTFTPTYEPSATVTVVRPDGASWANCYYRITYNVNAGSSNSYLQLVSVKFYKEGEGGVTPPEPTCDWDNIAYAGNGSGNADYTDRFKVCLGDPAPNFVNLQAPGWATEAGFYFEFPSAAWGAISLEEGEYQIQGAGILLFASAFLYDAEKEVTIVCQDVEYTITIKNNNPEVAPVVPITCAAVYELAQGAELALNNVVVTYANGKNVYVQDETGSMLLYLNSNTTWEAGNILSGVQGTLNIYNGLYEVKMTDAQVTAVQPGQGEAPAPVEFIAAPVAADMNKYIVLKNVTVSAETFPSNKNMNATIGEETFVLRNQFNADVAFDTNKAYDIIGAVAVYNSTVQVYFINATEATAPVEPLMKTIYCKMDKSWWTQDGAAVAVHYWGGAEAGTTWPGARMTPVEGQEGTWSYDVPADVDGLMFVRVNGSGDVVDWGAKTVNLTLPTDGKNLFTITNTEDSWGDPGCEGVWSVFGAEEQPEEPVANEWAEIKFVEAAAADEIAEDAAYAVPGTEFALTLHDSGNKMAIDGNACRFGTAEAYTMYNFRLKSGGASGSDKNYFTLNIPEAGILRLAPRTGSNSATDRALIVIQGGDTLYNQIVQESQAIEVPEGADTVKVYPYVDVTAAAGEVVVRYTGSMNFYAFAFKAAGGETPVNPIDHTSFATGDGWTPDAESSALWDAETGKITVTLAQPKVAAWQGQVFVNAVVAEVGKCYNFSVKMKANKSLAGATIKWQENNNDPIMVSEINTISLVANEEFVYNKTQIAGVEGNGQLVYDFGYAEAGTVIEIYDLVIEETECPVELSYTVAGSSAAVFGTAWDPTNAANDMVRQADGTYKWEKTNLELAAGELEFKVCENHAYTHAWPAQNYALAIPEGGLYTVTITFNPAAEADKVAAEAVKTGEAVVLPTVILHGNFTGSWADTDPFVAAADRLTAALTLTLAEGTYEFGFKFDGTWKANGANITRDANTANLATGEGNMHITADVAGDYVLVYTFATQELVVTYPVNALTIPEDAPVPTVAEDDVMAIYCNHYANNNANFGISGWAGGYQTLVLNEINVGYWTGMTWECIIDPAPHTDDAHDFSAYKNLHVDLWAPLPAKIKFAAEAVAGGNYKDGQVVEMQQGWNNVDFVVAEWAGNYDFKNLKCFVFEQYQTLEGASFEGNPFAFANIYFYGKEAQGIDNTNVEMNAVKFIENGQLIILKNGVKYNVMGVIVR